MDNFIEFLNTAESAELQKIEGIDQALAEQILAARPFSSDEDILAVKGFSSKKLEKIKSAFEKMDHLIYVPNTPARVPDKVQTSNATITIKTDMPQEKQPEKKDGFGHWFKRFVQTVLIILLVLAILSGVAAAFYYGLPYFYEKIIQPIEENTFQISQIATQQAMDLQTMQTQVAGLQSQIETLQSFSDDAGGTIASHTQSLSQLESMQSDLESALAQLKQDTSDNLAAQQSDLLNRLQYEVVVIRAGQYLSRANLYLSQSNYGSAREDVLAAYSLLTDFQSQAPQDKLAFLQSVTGRLELALNNLPAYPVIASNDIQIAWQLLVDGGTPVENVVVPLVTSTPLPSFTPTPYVTETTPQFSPTVPMIVDTPTPN